MPTQNISLYDGEEELIEVKKDMTSVWVLQPKLKTELKDRDNSSSIGEAKSFSESAALC